MISPGPFFGFVIEWLQIVKKELSYFYSENFWTFQQQDYILS